AAAGSEVFTSLRTPLLVSSGEIDLPLSLRKTVESGVLLTLEPSYRVIVPDYLILLERRGPGDHVADIGDQLFRRLSDMNISVDSFEFYTSPYRLLARALNSEELRTSLDIDELGRAFPNHRLIIVSDG